MVDCKDDDTVDMYDHEGSMADYAWYETSTGRLVAIQKLGQAMLIAPDGYYNDEEPTLEQVSVDDWKQNRCDFLEFQARLFWQEEPRIKEFVAKMSEGRGRDEEDRVEGIAWSRDEFGLKASCYERAERAWNNTK